MIPAERARLLSAATAPESPFLRMLLAIDHEELCIQRAADPPSGVRSGGLVITQSKAAAKAAYHFIIQTLRRPRSSSTLTLLRHEDIRRFRQNDVEWLVSVDMLTEGVDVPRLRTLV